MIYMLKVKRSICQEILWASNQCLTCQIHFSGKFGRDAPVKVAWWNLRLMWFSKKVGIHGLGSDINLYEVYQFNHGSSFHHPSFPVGGTNLRESTERLCIGVSALFVKIVLIPLYFIVV